MSSITQKNNTPQPGKRRIFLRLVWKLCAIGVLAEAFWLFRSIAGSLHKKSRTLSSQNIIHIPKAADIALNSVTPQPQGQFFLVREKGGGFLALSKRCTHLGCSLAWNQEQQQFVCPCHGSSFDQTGEVLKPPAVRGLDTFPIRVEDGSLRIDITAPEKWRGNNQDRVLHLQ